MAKKSKSTSPLSDVAIEMLAGLKKEFIESNRSSADLQRGYVGPNLANFQSQFLGSDSTSRVDYDLALKELEERKFVGTGPMEPFENDPKSSVIVFALFSKREYIYLKEEGYKMTRNKPLTPTPASKQNVHISGGSFYNSPVGVGGQVSQNINFDVSNEADSVKYLAELLAKTGQFVTDSTRADLVDMVKAANTGNMTAAKPIFQRVFGLVVEPIKQLAYGVLTAIITKQMGM